MKTKKTNSRDKIYASKKWLIEQSAAEAGKRYEDFCRVHGAMQHIVDAFCQCAFANHYYAGQWSAKTTDGMEWSVRFEQLGRRNPKTGRIEQTCHTDEKDDKLLDSD